MVAAEQTLAGWRPLVSPSVTDLGCSSVLLCGVQRELSLVDCGGSGGEEEHLSSRVCSPHAHVHDWQDNDDARTARVLLHDVGVVPELGHVCLARPQRRFVVLSPRRRYCVVAEGKLVTVFALADVRGGSGAWLPSQQVCELEAGLGGLLGVTVLEQPSNGQQLAIAEQSCPGCPGCAPRSADLCAPCVRPACVPPPQGEGVLLMLGSTGVSAMQLLAPSGRQLLESEQQQVTSGGVDDTNPAAAGQNE